MFICSSSFFLFFSDSLVGTILVPYHAFARPEKKIKKYISIQKFNITLQVSKIGCIILSRLFYCTGEYWNNYAFTAYISVCQSMDCAPVSYFPVSIDIQ